MNGTTVEVVASSWIEVLGGLSAKYMRSVPPLFCASAGAVAKATIAPATKHLFVQDHILCSLPEATLQKHGVATIGRRPRWSETTPGASHGENLPSSCDWCCIARVDLRSRLGTTDRCTSLSCRGARPGR